MWACFLKKESITTRKSQCTESYIFATPKLSSYSILNNAFNIELKHRNRVINTTTLLQLYFEDNYPLIKNLCCLRCKTRA